METNHSARVDLPVEAGVQHHNVKVGRYGAHYLKAGTGSPVLLLHGGASDSRDWLGTMDALSNSGTFYAPDLIGYGQSDKSKDGYYLSDFVDFTMGFSEALGLDGAVLVGHSLGGRVCLEMALRCPEKVRRLVLVNAAGFSRLARWGTFLGTTFWFMRKLLGQPQPFPRFLEENGGYGHWMCLDELPALKVPTLIVWSRHDPYYSLKGAVKAADLVPDARLEVLPCNGHAPHVRRRQAFNSLLLDFLNHAPSSDA
jgi:2-hydroxymuconate-semialdehyde hydrolase